MKCYACNGKLEPVFEGDEDETYQFHNALWVQLEGGYGMFFDDFDTGSLRAVICDECADSAARRLPWLGRLLGIVDTP